MTADLFAADVRDAEERALDEAMIAAVVAEMTR